jgi:hypothetical protein
MAIKRMPILFVVIILLFGTAPVSYGFTDIKDHNYTNSIELISGLEIMSGYENGTFLPDANITRADMAQIVNTIVYYNEGVENNNSGEWKSNFFGTKEDASALKVTNETVTERFSDVPEGYWAHDYIYAMAKLGLINGITENTFGPEENVNTVQIIKVFLDLMGYNPRAELNGGYPTGYLSIASELKLLSNIKISEAMTRGETAQFINNCLKIELLRSTAFGIDTKYETIKGETFMSEILGIDMLKGTVTDNGITSFFGASTLGKNDIKIGQYVLSLTGKTEYCKDYIGRHINCYYKNDKSNDEFDVVYAMLSNKDSVEVIDSKNFVSYDKNKISYKQGDNVLNVNIADGAYVIYNGIAIDTYTASIFSFDNGDISLVKSVDSSAVDIIIINSYRSWYVGKINEADYKIYNKIYPGESFLDNDILILDPSELSKTISIYKPDGSKGTFKDIKIDNILDVISNGNYVKIYISNSLVVDLQIEEKALDGDKLVLKGNGEEYIVNQDCADRAPEIKVGATYTLYLNRLKNVVWITEKSNSTIPVAYAIKIGTVGSSIKNDVRLKILDMSGNVITMEVAEKLTVSDFACVERTYKNYELVATFGTYKGIIRYTKNTEKKINYIEFPATSSNINKDKLHLILETNKANKAPLGHYKSSSGVIGGKIFIDDKTKILSINNELSDDSAYSLISKKDWINDTEYIIKAYSTVEGSVLAEYVEYFTTVAPTIVTTDRTVAIVKKMSSVLNKDGEPCVKLSVFNIASQAIGTDIDLFAKPDCLNNVKDTMMNDQLYTVEPGDIIRYKKNSSGIVDEIRLLWDENGVNPASIDGKRGNLAGTIGCYDPNAIDPKKGKSNPFAFSNTGGNVIPPEYLGGEWRTIYGFANVVRKGVLQMTTQDITAYPFDPTGSNEKYMVEYWKPYRITLVELKNKNVKVTVDSISNVKTHEEVGADCSRVVVMSRCGDIEQMIVINGSTQ